LAIASSIRIISMLSIITVVVEFGEANEREAALG
jgi:hypothetical protein